MIRSAGALRGRGAFARHEQQLLGPQVAVLVEWQLDPTQTLGQVQRFENGSAGIVANSHERYGGLGGSIGHEYARGARCRFIGKQRGSDFRRKGQDSTAQVKD